MKKYYLGLDIGTNSVGWAVTDEKFNILKAPVKGKYKNHDMWGIRLFESGKTAEDRRIKRTTRRRNKRKSNRIKMLQEIFAKYIAEKDPTFFIRLNESSLHYEDKSEEINTYRFPLFNESDYTDRDYYNEYPTIFHLRKELMKNSEKHDIRLVYLAIQHIIKNRGHFLIDGTISDAKNFKIVIEKLVNSFNDIGINLEISEQDGEDKVKEILTDKKLAKSIKAKQLVNYFAIPADSKEDKKTNKNAISEICKLMAGNKGDIKKIFENLSEEEELTTSFKFSESKYEDEIRDSLYATFPDETNCVERIKAVYDWSILDEILGNAESLSAAKVDSYEKHKENLHLLKYIMKKYCDKDVYQQFFNDKNGKGNNYASYIGTVSKGGKKYKIKKTNDEEEFYKELGKLIDSIESKVLEEDKEKYNKLKTEIELRKLLPLQRSKDNGVIPKQIHQQELEKILENASAYLPWLEEKDKDGYTAKEKILKLFDFRIPYYVGPLSTRHKEQGSNTWIVRKEGHENEKIYPWNYDKIIDLNKSNEEFINRMTNKCTYLVGEDVLPKNSLLYQKYMVLNEINNIKIKGKEITDAKLKQDIYVALFLNSPRITGKVTGKDLLKYLNIHGFDNELSAEDLSGFDGNFNTTLKSHLDFKRVFKDDFDKDEYKKIAEDIIKWITIYDDDKKMLEKAIKEKYPEQVSNEQLKKIRALKYSGWGNFSKRFLTGILGYADSETGEMKSIIQAMWDTNNNLMQLLSDRYLFIHEIEKENAEKRGEIKTISYEELVEPLYVSPAIKRSIWQTIQITEEIRKVMGCAPEKIFVEMARGEDKEKQRTVSRKQKLIELYNNCDKDVREWALQDIEERDERQFNSRKLFLYYLQEGKCAYTGEAIDINLLMNGSTNWDIDHIYPQSKIKDDSINNKVLVKRQVNAKKDNEMLSEDIQNKMHSTWKKWLDQGLMEKTKYDRLTRKSDFTEDELAGFIARQLVETRQSTKVIADLLKQLYEKQGSKIVYVKSALASSFRKEPLNVLKCRRINDFHHAKDAYLNIVVGEVYNTKFTDNPYKWIKENKDKKYSISKVMYWDVKDRKGDVIWQGCDKEYYQDNNGKKKAHYARNEENEVIGGDIDRIREIARRDTVLYTEYTYCEKGELFDQTIHPAGSKKATIPIKKGMDVAKYGGFTSANTSYFAEIEFDGRKKGSRQKQIVGVPIYIANQLEYDPNSFLEYCEEKLELKNVVILKEKIKKNALIRVDGFPMRLRGQTVAQNLLKGNVQLILNLKNQETIRKIEKFLDKGNGDFNEKFDGINEIMLIDLYDVFTEKLLMGMYKNRPANQGNTMKIGKEIFLELTMKQKCEVLYNANALYRCDIDTKANLKLIKGSDNAGNMAISKNTLGTSDVYLINQSVTGLFENREKL